MVDVEAAVPRIVNAANERTIQLVWIGPPCVFKDWDSAAAELDRRLAAQLRNLGVIFVSMRDPSVRDRAVRAGDGVHFTMTGYQRMWSLAAAAAGVAPGRSASRRSRATTQVVAAAPRGVPTTPPPLPVPNPMRPANTAPAATLASRDRRRHATGAGHRGRDCHASAPAQSLRDGGEAANILTAAPMPLPARDRPGEGRHRAPLRNTGAISGGAGSLLPSFHRLHPADSDDRDMGTESAGGNFAACDTAVHAGNREFSSCRAAFCN